MTLDTATIRLPSRTLARLAARALYLLPAAGAAQNHTIAFNGFAPANTEIFVADADGSNPRALLPHPALDYNASFSSDGAWVYFTSERDGSADIYRARPDGSAVERVVGSPAFDDQAAPSPDGRSLAFVSSRAGNADVWVVDLETRAARNLTAAPSGEFRPAWSPDGQWLAFVSDRAPPRTSCVASGAATGPGPFVTPQYTSVFAVRADGTELRRISDGVEVAGGPVWSADGGEIVFHSAAPEEVCTGGLMFATGTSQIVAVALGSGARTTLTAGPGLKVFPRAAGATRIGHSTPGGFAFTAAGGARTGDYGRPSWSANGHALVFHRDVAQRDDPGYTVIRKPSPDPRFALLALPGHASFSPDATRMVFTRTSFGTGPAGSGALIIANVDGTEQRMLFESPPTDNLTGPAWSPRGDAIAFGLGAFLRRAGTAPARLMTIRPDGTGLTALGDGTTNDGMPSWAPNGKELVFRVAAGPARGLYVLDVDSGVRRPLRTGSDRDTFPYWSPRGDWIVFTSQRDGDYEIYKIRPDGSEITRLTAAAGHDAHASVSPDGEWVAFTTGRQGFKDEAFGLRLGARPPPFQSYGEIGVMRIDGSDFRLLTDNAIEEGVPVWIPPARPAD